MTFDSVLLEVRRAREVYAQQFNGDVRAMMDDLRRRYAESDRKSSRREPKSRYKTPETSKQDGG